MNRPSTRIYEFGSFRLLPEERQLLSNGQAVSLTPKAFDLLCVLVEHNGHLVTKNELMERIWPDSFVEEANLSVKMSALRRVLDQGPEDQQFIETVPRQGYRFLAPVTEHRENGRQVNGAVADASVPDEMPAAPTTPRITWRHYWKHGFILAALSALIFGLVFEALRRSAVVEHPGHIRSVAILPLQNKISDPSHQHVEYGITDPLISALSRIDSLKTITRQSVMRYKDSPMTPAEIGRELNVDAVFAGSLEYSGDRIGLDVQMIHTGSDRSFWRKTYSGNLADLQALHQEITRDIMDAVRINLTQEDRSRLSAPAARDPEAYDQFLRGRFFSYRQTAQDNEASVKALETAVALDPDFAPAFAELAQAYVWKLFLFDPKNERVWAEKAYLASEKALALDPNLAVAYLARGRLLWTPANSFPHEKAIREYRRALALDPNLDEARNQLSLIYCHIGAFEEALEESAKAMAVNPANNLAQFRKGQTLNFQGRYDEALAVLSALPPKTNPALVGYQSAWALFNLGRADEASVMLDKLLKDNPEDSGGLYTSVQAVIDASRGRTVDAENKIRKAIEIGKGFGHFHHTAYHIACAYARMNKVDLALKWLEASAKDGFPCYRLFETDQNLDNLRADPRFAAFLAEQSKQWERFKLVLQSER